MSFLRENEWQIYSRPTTPKPEDPRTENKKLGKVYKIRHKPTGLFYDIDGLNKDGMVYRKNDKDLSLYQRERIYISNSIHKEYNIGEYSKTYRCFLADILVEDWEIVEFNIEEVKIKEKSSTNIPLDTPIYVYNDFGVKFKRYFAGLTKDGKIKAWLHGKTSFSVENSDEYSTWDNFENIKRQTKTLMSPEYVDAGTLIDSGHIVVECEELDCGGFFSLVVKSI